MPSYITRGRRTEPHAPGLLSRHIIRNGSDTTLKMSIRLTPCQIRGTNSSLPTRSYTWLQPTVRVTKGDNSKRFFRPTLLKIFRSLLRLARSLEECLFSLSESPTSPYTLLDPFMFLHCPKSSVPFIVFLGSPESCSLSFTTSLKYVFPRILHRNPKLLQ